MIKTIRALIRLLLFFIISLCTVLLVGIGNFIVGWVIPQWAVIWKNYIIRSWAWLTARLLNMEISIEGTPPKPPFVLVSNHLSYLDVAPLWLYLDGTFIAKSEIKSWPFFGWATKILGVIFIDRELRRDVHRVNTLIKSTITEQQGIILFPEGTSTKGETVLPFHPSLLQYSAKYEMPVHFASLTYQSWDPQKPASEYICWWGDMSFFDHFWELLKMPGFEVKVTFGDHQIVNTDRKQLAQQLHQLVEASFEPVQQIKPQEKRARI